MSDSKKMAAAIKRVFERLSSLPKEELHSLVQKHRGTELAGLLSGKAYANSAEVFEALQVTTKYDIDIVLPVTPNITAGNISSSYIASEASKEYSWSGVSGTFIVSGSIDKTESNTDTKAIVTWPIAA